MILICRFQELDLSAEALVFNDSSRADSWLNAIENGLPKGANYFKVLVLAPCINTVWNILRYFPLSIYLVPILAIFGITGSTIVYF